MIVRGRKVLPFAPDAFRKLVDSQGRFKVPTVFVTNGGNMLRHDKALQLSNWLGIDVSFGKEMKEHKVFKLKSRFFLPAPQIHEDQVVMAHSPLKMFRGFHDKRVFVSGQGPVVDIAGNLGFNKITTIDDVRSTFPVLDAVDHKRRVSAVRV